MAIKSEVKVGEVILNFFKKHWPEIAGVITAQLKDIIDGIRKNKKMTEQEIIRLVEITSQLSQKIKILYAISIFALTIGILNLILILFR